MNYWNLAQMKKALNGVIPITEVEILHKMRACNGGMVPFVSIFGNLAIFSVTVHVIWSVYTLFGQCTPYYVAPCMVFVVEVVVTCLILA